MSRCISWPVTFLAFSVCLCSALCEALYGFSDPSVGAAVTVPSVHQGSVTGVVFVGDSAVWTTGFDGRIRVFDTVRGEHQIGRAHV